MNAAGRVSRIVDNSYKLMIYFVTIEIEWQICIVYIIVNSMKYVKYCNLIITGSEVWDNVIRQIREKRNNDGFF